MPPSGCPGEGSAHGDPSFALPSGLLLKCKEPPLWAGGGQWPWLLGFQIWPRVARKGNPQDLSIQSQCQPIAPKKEELLGFPEEGDVRSEMSLRESAQ